MNIAFYSYKGGVGRTQTLVGVGLELVRRGKRVCLIDVDVEAPGIHHLLGIEPEEQQSLLEHLVWRNMSILPTRVVHVEELFGTPLNELLGEETRGALYALPSRPDRTKLRKIREGEILPFFRESLAYLEKALALDYILLDSRTGFARFAPLTLKSADLFVLVTRLDMQNARGMRDLLQITSKRPRIVVASMVPEPDRDISKELRTEKLDQFREAAGGGADTIIPFDKRLLFGDCLPAVEFDQDCPICKATVELVEKILEVRP